jgi:hypothetical protein
MSGPGLAQVKSDPLASPEVRRALARLSQRDKVATGEGIEVDPDGRLRVFPDGATTPYRAITAATVLTSEDYTIHATSGGPFTQPLLTSVGVVGRVYVVKNNSGGTITLDPDGAELVDGAATLAID